MHCNAKKINKIVVTRTRGADAPPNVKAVASPFDYLSTLTCMFCSWGRLRSRPTIQRHIADRHTYLRSTPEFFVDSVLLGSLMLDRAWGEHHNIPKEA